MYLYLWLLSIHVVTTGLKYINPILCCNYAIVQSLSALRLAAKATFTLLNAALSQPWALNVWLNHTTDLMRWFYYYRDQER